MVEKIKIAEGYKQTEVGVFPVDWEVKNYGDIFENIGGGAFRSKDAQNTGIKWLKIANVGINRIKWDEKSFLPSYLVEEFERFLLKENDYVIALTRPILNKKLKIAKLSKSDAPALLNQRVGKLVSTKNDIDFVYYLLQSSTSINSLLDNIAGTDPPNLGNKQLYSITCALPPTRTEQIAIAATLSDMDALIEGLEKLLVKKRNIKQGAMQELLTPKEGWEVKTVAQIGKPYGGLSGKSKNDFKNGTMPYIPFMNVMSNPIIDITYFDYVKIDASENQNKAQKGDLIFNTSSETPEEVGMCSVLLEDIPNLYLNSFCFGFRFHKEIKDDGLYLSYFFRSSYGREKLYLLAQGATRYNLSKSNFIKLELELPIPEEQTHIAKILSDMDTEIEQLEIQLSKYKMLKIGMMQELLTGKKRLI